MPASALAKTPKSTAGRSALPIEEQIRARAYELYVERGNESGSEMDDWLQAEKEMLDAQERRAR